MVGLRFTGKHCKGHFLSHDPASYYDDYWRKRDLERGRAAIGLQLLGEKRGLLLEVGCGPGWALERFREAGFNVKGLDASAVDG